MDREQFEQLVSQWLDDPQDERLRARIEAGVAESQELARLREQWQRLDGLIRQVVQSAREVDWGKLQQRLTREIARAIDEPAEGAAKLNGLLRAQTDVAERVDWQRFGDRVSATAVVSDRRSVRRFPWRAALAVGLAAAAVVALVVLRPAERSEVLTGFAVGRVISAGESVGASSASAAFARVTVHVSEGPARSDASPTERSARPSGEVFLVISSVARAGAAGPPAVFQSF